VKKRGIALTGRQSWSTAKKKRGSFARGRGKLYEEDRKGRALNPWIGEKRRKRVHRGEDQLTHRKKKRKEALAISGEVGGGKI